MECARFSDVTRAAASRAAEAGGAAEVRTLPAYALMQQISCLRLKAPSKTGSNYYTPVLVHDDR